MQHKKVLLIGKSGQVSQSIQSVWNAEQMSAELVVADRSVLDLSQTDQIQKVLETFEPDFIINPAAFTAVDLAEQETELAFAINRDAVGQIGAFAASKKIPVIHYSTDYVFAGDASNAYQETDSTQPQGVYGQSKLEGEQQLIESGADAVILRTSWVYSNFGKNFYKTMLMLAESKNELSVVNDQIGSPTFAGSIAQATIKIVSAMLKDNQQNYSGVYHLTNAGQTSWCDFAREIFEQTGNTHVTVNGIPSSEYPTPAKRPVFSVLDNTKLHSTFGIEMPDWQLALQQCIQQASSEKLD